MAFRSAIAMRPRSQSLHAAMPEFRHVAPRNSARSDGTSTLGCRPLLLLNRGETVDLAPTVARTTLAAMHPKSLMWPSIRAGAMVRELLSLQAAA
jgi:hypothetical protein